ncbi:hypothetical protein I7I50_06069 [Histoplasma capsulatum G186AR]|uniref:Uncharacterized protein n=1 Tax=Ajellomyces capsulatus TaxID=5037 RepID=A0A8H8D228_AJECA|nr:hypothetical protein I7I52_08807 [Histoplasma capsulatum]QSS67088.1 hypothetical protein I7I50_06069 [Histoplasma capsulatum G186AR]
MKAFISLTSFALAFFPPFSSAVLPNQSSNLDFSPFGLFAISPRGFIPKIQGKLQIVSDAVVIGPAQGARDFTAYIYPLPKGEMKISGGEDGRFFLDPGSHHPTPGYHTLKFGHTSSAQSSSHGFFITNTGCGPHCGGPQLVHDAADNGDGTPGNWLAYPLDGANGKSGYSIHWAPGGPFPEGHKLIYLMCEPAPQ